MNNGRVNILWHFKRQALKNERISLGLVLQGPGQVEKTTGF